MKREEAAAMMTRLMGEFDLIDKGWTFAWMSRRRTLGLCKYGPRQLLLSTVLVDHNSEDVVEQVCRHEIAHALAGHQAAHGPEWISMAYKCGVRNPSAKCYEAELPPGRYQATCPSCSKVYSMERRPKQMNGRSRYCPPCYRSTGNLAAAELTFRDSRTPIVSLPPQAPVNAPVSVQQSTPAQTVAPTSVGAPNAFSAPQVAAAMGVDAKSFRAWLRKYPAMERNFKTTGAWLFPADRVPDVVAAWNATH